MRRPIALLALPLAVLALGGCGGGDTAKAPGEITVSEQIANCVEKLGSDGGIVSTESICRTGQEADPDAFALTYGITYETMRDAETAGP